MLCLYVRQSWSPYSVKISTEFSTPFGNRHLASLICFYFCSSCPVSSLFTVSPLLRSFWISPVFLAMCLPLNLVATWASLLLTLGSLWALSAMGFWLLWLLNLLSCHWILPQSQYLGVVFVSWRMNWIHMFILQYRRAFQMKAITYAKIKSNERSWHIHYADNIFRYSFIFRGTCMTPYAIWWLESWQYLQNRLLQLL